jgi:glycine hydroxymethyltransferase
MRQVGAFIDKLITECKAVQEKSGSKKLKDFQDALAKSSQIKALAAEVEEFASQFDIPGFDANKIDA